MKYTIIAQRNSVSEIETTTVDGDYREMKSVVRAIRKMRYGFIQISNEYGVIATLQNL